MNQVVGAPKGQVIFPNDGCKDMFGEPPLMTQGSVLAGYDAY